MADPHAVRIVRVSFLAQIGQSYITFSWKKKRNVKNKYNIHLMFMSDMPSFKLLVRSLG